MASKRVANSMLVLRLFALAASVATIALVATNNVKFLDDSEGKFHQVIAFRYVLAVAAIAAAYGVVQLPFALYYAVQKERLIRHGFLKDFDFFGDKLISLLLATGVGAGFAVSCEFKRIWEELFNAFDVPKNDDTRVTTIKFWDRGIIASAVLTVALISMAAVSIISSIKKSRSRGMFA